MKKKLVKKAAWEWDADIGGVEKEKEKLLDILAQIVPQSEVFLKKNFKEDTRRQ